MVCAVDDLNLAIADEELLVLVGPSGCGKTTTLRMVAGLERPTAGTIRIDGREVHGLPPRDRDVAMVFQRDCLYPHMTVRENLTFGLRMRGAAPLEIRRQVMEIAHLLGIETLLDRRPSSLSGGEARRSALGRAMVRRPKLFLFDEPLSGLDAVLRARLRVQIKLHQRRLHTTLLYVTHDQEEAMVLGDRIAVMRAGTVQQCGPPLEVYDRPANRFVAGFIGMPPMNLLSGRLHRQGSALHFDGGGLWLDWPAGHPAFPQGPPEGEVILGVRPQHLHVVSLTNSVASPGHLPGAARTSGLRLASVESTGDRTWLHLTTPDGAVITALSPSAAPATHPAVVEAEVNPAELHFFVTDEPGKRLS